MAAVLLFGYWIIELPLKLYLPLAIFYVCTAHIYLCLELNLLCVCTGKWCRSYWWWHIGVMLFWYHTQGYILLISAKCLVKSVFDLMFVNWKQGVLKTVCWKQGVWKDIGDVVLRVGLDPSWWPWFCTDVESLLQWRVYPNIPAAFWLCYIPCCCSSCKFSTSVSYTWPATTKLLVSKLFLYVHFRSSQTCSLCCHWYLWHTSSLDAHFRGVGAPKNYHWLVSLLLKSLGWMVLFIVMRGCSWHSSFSSMLLLAVCELCDPHSIFLFLRVHMGHLQLLICWFKWTKDLFSFWISYECPFDSLPF